MICEYGKFEIIHHNNRESWKTNICQQSGQFGFFLWFSRIVMGFFSFWFNVPQFFLSLLQIFVDYFCGRWRSVGYYGQLQIVLGLCRVFQGKLGLLLSVLGRCGSLCMVFGFFLFGRCESFWVISLLTVYRLLWDVVVRCEQFLDHCGSLWIFVDRCGFFRIAVSCCASL